MRKVWKAAFSLSALGAATVVAGGAAPAQAGELLILHRLHHKTTDTHMFSSLVDRHGAAAAYAIRAQDRPGAAADDLHGLFTTINRNSSIGVDACAPVSEAARHEAYVDAG